MPAAAVIPAPIAYIKVAAVKKLVVEVWYSVGQSSLKGGGCLFTGCISQSWWYGQSFTRHRRRFHDPFL